jgi:hypothetical protein
MFWIKKMICNLIGHNYNHDKRKLELVTFLDGKETTSMQIYCNRCQQFKEINSVKNKTVRG